MDVSIRTPARGVTELLEIRRYIFGVSIRTPARGVTVFTERLQSNVGVSIRTPARGVTGACVRDCSGNPRFNPHTCERCDVPCKKCILCRKVSIRTPARGVTD